MPVLVGLLQGGTTGYQRVGFQGKEAGLAVGRGGDRPLEASDLVGIKKSFDGNAAPFSASKGVE